MYEGPPPTNPIGPINNAASLGIIVDNDKPTTTISGGQYLQPGQSLVLSGVATDTTSYMTAVSRSASTTAPGRRPPSIRRSHPTAPLRAGRSRWVAPSSDGIYTIRARSTDAVGNVGDPSTPLTVIVDSVLPEVTTDITGNPSVRAAAGPDQQWLIALSGTATDNSAGVDHVEAMINGFGERWQIPEYDPATRRWQMYYTLPGFDATNNAVVDPTGQYTFVMRAYDKSGNVRISAPVQLRIDQQAPATTLDTPASITTDTVISTNAQPSAAR